MIKSEGRVSGIAIIGRCSRGARVRDLVVTQTGICGFEHYVTAAATYKKVSAKKPKFGED
jgi:hypothetical protein